ncbi:MAG: hypothetical protein V4736_15955 [Bdellovibrionota bacterium]
MKFTMKFSILVSILVLSFNFAKAVVPTNQEPAPLAAVIGIYLDAFSTYEDALDEMIELKWATADQKNSIGKFLKTKGLSLNSKIVPLRLNKNASTLSWGPYSLTADTNGVLKTNSGKILRFPAHPDVAEVFIQTFKDLTETKVSVYQQLLIPNAYALNVQEASAAATAAWNAGVYSVRRAARTAGQAFSCSQLNQSMISTESALAAMANSEQRGSVVCVGKGYAINNGTQFQNQQAVLERYKAELDAEFAAERKSRSGKPQVGYSRAVEEHCRVVQDYYDNFYGKDLRDLQPVPQRILNKIWPDGKPKACNKTRIGYITSQIAWERNKARGAALQVVVLSKEEVSRMQMEKMDREVEYFKANPGEKLDVGLPATGQ